MKNSNANDSCARYFKAKYAFVLVVPTFFLGLVSPELRYLSYSPTTYYLINTVYDAAAIVRYKEKLQHSDSIIEDYQKQIKRKLSSTERVLMIAISASTIFKEKNRAIANGSKKSEEVLKAQIRLLDVCHKILFLDENTTLEFWDFSPAQWLIANGPAEIFIVSTPEYRLSDKSNKVLYIKALSILEHAEKGLSSVSNEKQKIYSEKLVGLRAKILSLKVAKR